MRLLIGAVTVAGLLLVASGAARALEPRSNLFDFSRHAKYVVSARVDRLQTCPSRDGNLFTYVFFNDVETLEKESDSKPAPRELILRIPGGMVDGMVEIVTDAPVFRSDERVLLFLTRDPQQQVPIVFGAMGVFLLTDQRTVRSHGGPAITEINKQYDILLDPIYKPEPRDARHWDPNMVAVRKEAERSVPLGTAPPQVQPHRAMQLDEFRTHLKNAWREADRVGRLPKELDFSARNPYADLPVAPRKGEKQ
jgi:hypothetical protein